MSCKLPITLHRLEAMADRDSDSGCLLWRGATAGKGYGRFKSDGRSYYAHRAMYELAHGEIPTGMLVCHKCDNPRCINPSHLFLGSNEENMQDMVQKRRQAHGERAASAVLTEKQAQEIRDSRLGKRRLSRAFGVSESAVAHVRAKRTWRHLPDSQTA